jgi:hypothetical protein
MENQYPLDYPYADLRLDKLCIIGEFPTKNTGFNTFQYLETIWKNDFAGALAWSYRADDEASDFKNTADEFKTWSDSHEKDVHIGSLK